MSPEDEKAFKKLKAERKALPEAWAGLRGEALQKLTGVSDAVFCNPGLFICGADTLEGARALAKLALVAGEAA